MRTIYLDYASLTPIDRRVQREMAVWSREPLNPSSIHSLGTKAKKAVDEARKTAADLLHAHADEVVFTSGGTEANGLALEGAARAAHRKGIARPHLVISAVEHSSVIEAADMMERHGVEVTRLGVDKDGVIDSDELKSALKPETFLVSVMAANNETGVVQPIREIAKAVRDARKRDASRYPLFHTDACQAVLYEDLNVEKLGVDLLTLDASKACGPRGTGLLYMKRGTPIEPILYGGGQEGGLRSGTEDVPAIRGFAKALEIAGAEREREAARVAAIRDRFEAGLKGIAPALVINGGGASRMPHVSNVSIPGVDGEMLVLCLDANGVLASTKSACLRDEDESYVLRAMGADSSSSVRFSFGRMTAEGDVRRALAILRRLLGVS